MSEQKYRKRKKGVMVNYKWKWMETIKSNNKKDIKKSLKKIRNKQFKFFERNQS